MLSNLLLVLIGLVIKNEIIILIVLFIGSVLICRGLLEFFLPIKVLMSSLISKSQLLVGVEPEDTESAMSKVYWTVSIVCPLVILSLDKLTGTIIELCPLTVPLLSTVNFLIVFHVIKSIVINIRKVSYLDS